MIRTCSEICIEAKKNKNDLVYLCSLWQREVLPNKKKYPLVELEFMAEYFSDFINKGELIKPPIILFNC